MKTYLIALTAAALTFAPRPAVALGDTEAAILGGILGGVLVGAAINHGADVDFAFTSGRPYGPGYGHGDHRRDGRHYERGGRHHDRDGRYYDRGGRHYDRPNGHWIHHTVKVWVPSRTTYSCDRWGNRVRHYERGYWTFRTEKVWVPARGRW